MWTRFTFEDIRIIAHYLGTLTSLFTVALLIPLITALVFQEWEPATRYFLAAGISLTIVRCCVWPRSILVVLPANKRWR